MKKIKLSKNLNYQKLRKKSVTDILKSKEHISNNSPSNPKIIHNLLQTISRAIKRIFRSKSSDSYMVKDEKIIVDAVSTTFTIHSIKTKFIIAFICFALIPFIFLCIIYTIVSKNALRATSSTLNAEIVRQATQNIDNSINSVYQDVMDFGVNTIMESGYLKEAKSTDKNKQVNATLEINNLISSFNSVSKTYYGNSCLYIPGSSQSLGSITGLPAKELPKYIEGIEDTEFIWMSIPELKGSGQLVIKPFSDFRSHTKFYVCTSFTLAPVSEYLSSLSLLKDSTVFLADIDHSLLMSSQSNTELPQYIVDKISSDTELKTFSTSDYLVSYNTLANGWKLIVETPYSSLTEQLDAALPIIAILFICIMLLACILGYFYANSFSKPIIGLMSLMSKAEQGDLTITAPIKGRDEISELCRSFNHMIENIKDLIAKTQEVVTQNIDSSNTLSESSNYSVTTIKQLAIAVNEIAEGTTNQASDAQKSTQDMQSLSEQMDTVTQKTSAILSSTEEAKNMIEDATSTINALNTTMTSSLSMTSDICTSITELNTLTKNIEDIMRLMAGISEQTNLLALNASIEAARAGESGRGFAVVANEVRNLAEQSKSSTVSVRSALDSINHKMKETVSLAQKSSQMIDEQESVVTETRQLFNKVIQSLTSMVTELNDISQSILTMRGLKDIMVERIDSIASVTEESAASTEEVSSLATEQQSIMQHFAELSNELSSSTQKLNDVISKFVIFKDSDLPK